MEFLMGALQAITGGFGKLGSEIGAGDVTAQQQELQKANIEQNWQMNYVRNQLEQQRLQQTWDIAQQQHDLTRQQIIQQGYRDMGATIDPASGQYYRTFINPATGDTRRVPVQGTPPDSPQGMMNYFQQVRGLKDSNGNPLLSDTEAAQIAFRMPMLYRQGPAAQFQSFVDQAQDYANQGIKSIKGPDGKQIDLTSPQGRIAYAQMQQDLIYGRSGFFHYGPGNLLGGGAAKDLSGFTAGEQREYNAYIAPYKAQELLLGQAMRAAYASAITPDQQQQVTNTYLPQIAAIQQAENSKYQEILARHRGGQPPTNAQVSQANSGKQYWSAAAYKKANPKATESQVEQAMTAAKAAGATVTQ